MARYLTPEWLAELQAAAAGPAPQLAGIEAVTVEHEIADASGDVVFHVEIGPSGIAVLPGPADRPTVTFVQDRATAAAITRGELSAQAAYMTGRLRIRGDMATLAKAQPALAQLDDAYAELRDRTTY